MDAKNYPPGVIRLIAHLEARSITPVMVELPTSTHTASAAALAVDCQLAQIVKSLVFITIDTQRPLLVLASGVNRVNTLRLAEVIGEKVRLADEQSVLQWTGYTVGAVPPVGYDPQPLTLIDEDLSGHEKLWVSGGSDHTMIALTFQEICRLTGGEVTTINRQLFQSVFIAPYDPNWKSRFYEEKMNILAAAGKYFKDIEHIGSTAVPGLAAKPIVDVMAGAVSLDDAPHFIPPLEAIGYQYIQKYEIQMPERRYLTRSVNNQVVTHLHIVGFNSPFWKRHLAFRNQLIANPDLRDAYSRLKIELSRKYGRDRVGYTDAKTAFIHEALGQKTD
jgi:GrpB-like predicted nucleotidyltransferase (UPF0157 family)/prolyl-tRNA editing enzyme YbaK/EbsC (Cys-tRNA(Pro) deacylase)